MLVSVIIPVYNVEAFLAECLDSVLGQSYAELEVIVVNDGATDGCQEIIDAYAQRDGRIIALQKPNGGLSDARNFGMAHASGEFICFVDSDDFLAPTAIEQLLSFALENHCEAVQGGFYYLFEDRLEFSAELKRPDGRGLTAEAQAQRPGDSGGVVVSDEEAMGMLIDNKVVKNFAWGKLYRADLLKGLEFPVGRFFEDSFWQHLVLSRVSRYGIINEPLYFYRQRSSSISGSASDRIIDLLRGTQLRCEYIRSHYPALFPKAIYAYWQLLLDICWPPRSHSAARGEFFAEAVDAYGADFRRHAGWLYRLSTMPALLNAALFGRRLWRHFFAKRPQRVARR